MAWGDFRGEISKVLSSTAYQTYEKRILKEVLASDLPQHVAIIMDGNRRFARSFGLTRLTGHKKGKDKLEELMDWCLEIGIKMMTVYAFSTENLSRDTKEINDLMDMFEENFRKVGDDERVHKHQIRVRAIGKTDTLPERVQKAIKYAEDRTRDYDQYYYTIAIAYGSREEMLGAIKDLARDVKEGKLGESLLRQQNILVMYHNIEGHRYKIDVWWNPAEALAMVGMKAPEE